jgi:phosphinothricin acetyltransferase
MPPTIRLATADDADQVQAIYAPHCHTPVSFELAPPSVEEVRDRLAKVLCQYPWLLCEGYVNAYAGVTLPNPASVGLHEAMGFQPVGVYRQVGFKCGAWHDVAWYQRPLQPRAGEPPSPRRLEEVRHTEQWAEALRRGVMLL